MKNFFLFIFLSSSIILIGQNNDQNWFAGSRFAQSDFYDTYQLDFGEFPVKISEASGFPSFHVTSSSFSDSIGTLEFYSNGINIRNRSHEIVEGGENINPGQVRNSFTGMGYPMPKGAFFLPHPGNDSLLYFIHASYDNSESVTDDLGPEVVYYTLINKLANNGKGRVIEVNQPLIIDLVRPPVANRHANGRDWWIIISKNYENHYYKFLLTPEGFQGPFEQKIGSEEIHDSFQGVRGLQNFSPDGSTFINYSGIEGFSLFEFDRCTGELYNEDRLSFNTVDSLGWTFDAAFSANNRFLYISNLWATRRFGLGAYNFSNPLLIQYDLWSDDFAISADTIGFKDSIENPFPFQPGVAFSGLQLAPDGKIYSITPESRIHTIMEPNRKGKNCKLLKRFPFVEKGMGLAYPYYPNYRLGPLDNSPCDTLDINNNPIANYRYENWDSLNPLHIEFADLSYYEPAEWFWEFENLGTSRDTNPEFTFPAPGIYEVCLTVSNVNSSNRTCKNVPVGQVSDVEEAWEKGEPVVFPNPTSNAFQIYNPTSQVVGIQLFNVSGQRIIEKKNTTNGEQIDVSFLPEGIYFYSFLNEENQLVKSGKLIISR